MGNIWSSFMIYRDIYGANYMVLVQHLKLKDLFQSQLDKFLFEIYLKYCQKLDFDGSPNVKLQLKNFFYVKMGVKWDPNTTPGVIVFIRD